MSDITYDTTLLDGRVKMHQTNGGLRVSMDSVFLAQKVSVANGDTILDIGCGTGAVGLCINELSKNYNLHLTGLDIQPHLIKLAVDNALLNNMHGRYSYVCGDVADKTLFDAQAFDHVVMNPPYFKDGERLKSPDIDREIAFTGNLNVWMSSALYWVKHGGSLTMIHRAEALNDILSLARGKFGAIEVWPIYSKPSAPAIRVIVKMIRNRKTPMVIHSGILLPTPLNT